MVTACSTASNCSFAKKTRRKQPSLASSRNQSSVVRLLIVLGRGWRTVVAALIASASSTATTALPATRTRGMMGFNECFELIARERAVFVRVGFVEELIEARAAGRAGLSSALLTSTASASATAALLAALLSTTLSTAATL